MSGELDRYYAKDDAAWVADVFEEVYPHKVTLPVGATLWARWCALFCDGHWRALDRGDRKTTAGIIAFEKRDEAERCAQRFAARLESAGDEQA